MRFSRLAHTWFGLYFGDRRRSDLERGVKQAFAATTCKDLDDYYHMLQDDDRGTIARAQLVNALTVSETHFFRNEAQFDALLGHVLPQIIERRRDLRTLRIWSAGCASGEEPYSIAMLLRMLLPDVDDWSITILGTDVNTASLDRARRAVYSSWAFRETRAKHLRTRYFRPQGNHYALVPEIRNMVTFGRLNLMEDPYPAYETNTTFMDLILCRNVTIYFSEQVTRQVVGSFYDSLVDGGWLVVGHSEYALGTYRQFQTRSFDGAILYQRDPAPLVQPRDWSWWVGQRAKPKAMLPVNPPVAPAEVPVPAPIEVPVAAPVDTTVAVPPEVPAPVSPAIEQEDQDPVEMAQELLEYGHSERARDLLSEVIVQEPGNAPVCALLGQAYANLGQWDEAKKWCQQAIDVDKLSLEAYYTLALVAQHQGELDAALDAMKKVVYIDRSSILGHFGLADLYHNKRQFPMALKSLDNVYRLLAKRANEETIPGSGGITTARLRETIVRQQQQWQAEASDQVALS
jgi:chemotaxis protein methyltransferase CheR